MDQFLEASQTHSRCAHSDVGLGVSGYALTTAVQWALANCLPRSFDDTETSMISQGLSLVIQDSLLVAVRLVSFSCASHQCNWT